MSLYSELNVDENTL